MALQNPRNWFKSPPHLEHMSRTNRFIHHVLGRIFQYRDIVKEEEDTDVFLRSPINIQSLYLRRFFLIRKGPFKLFLHFINRSDNDRHMHDHPWDFTSLCLSGGYMESSANGVRGFRPGQILRNTAEHRHKVILRQDSNDAEIPAWTLIHTKKARRVWGFHTEDGWVDWRTYLGIPDEPDSAEDI